ncbi:hypothetical protein ACLK1T_06760 [Escherichia coli]
MKRFKRANWTAEAEAAKVVFVMRRKVVAGYYWPAVDNEVLLATLENVAAATYDRRHHDAA